MVSLHIKVKPGSFKDEILIDKDGTFIVKIREKPIDGAANEYLVRFLSKEFGISRNSVVLEKGQTSKFKKITLHISETEFNSLLNKYRSQS
jgi:uncharacterized protein (TIGR00251 family)